MPGELKLYTFKLCPFAHRVRLMLAEKGLAAEPIEIDLKNKPAAFVSLSPTGRVPLQMHGSRRIWESAVILEYLDETFPEPRLMPADPTDRATVRLWIDFANTRLFAPTHRLIFERDEEQRRIQVRQMEGAVGHLEHEGLCRRDNGPYLLGEQFTLADIALYPWFEQLATFERFSTFRMPPKFIGVRAWMAAVAARPAVKQCSQADDWYEANYRRYLAA
jgi:glutathione S-transferase